MTDDPRHERIRAAVLGRDTTMHALTRGTPVTAGDLERGLCALLDELAGAGAGVPAEAYGAAWRACDWRHRDNEQVMLIAEGFRAGWDAAIAAVEARRMR